MTLFYVISLCFMLILPKVESVAYGDPCTAPTAGDPGDCTDAHGACSATSSGTCGCATNYVASASNVCELKAKIVGGSCTPGTGACEDPNAECTGSGTTTCTCTAAYQTKTSDLTCEPKPRKVGGSCTTGPDACEDLNAECTGSGTTTCTCTAAYHTKTPDLTCAGVAGLTCSMFLLGIVLLVSKYFQ